MPDEVGPPPQEERTVAAPVAHFREVHEEIAWQAASDATGALVQDDVIRNQPHGGDPIPHKRGERKDSAHDKGVSKRTIRNVPRPIGNLLSHPHTAPPNDNFADAQTIRGQTASVDGTNVWATLESGDPSSVFYRATSHTVWFRWTAPFSGPAWVNTCTSDYDTLLGVFTGRTLGSLTELAGNDDACGYRASKARFSATKNTTYYILVDGYSGSQGTFTLGVDLTRSIDCRMGQVVCNGTDTKDRITGTRSKDSIKAYGGEDQIYGRGGDDVAIGGGDDDGIDGNNGQDRLYGGDGDDLIYTGGLDGDRDSVYCGAGHDMVLRERRKDRVADDCEEVYTYSAGGGGGGGY